MSNATRYLADIVADTPFGTRRLENLRHDQKDLHDALMLHIVISGREEPALFAASLLSNAQEAMAQGSAMTAIRTLSDASDIANLSNIGNLSAPTIRFWRSIYETEDSRYSKDDILTGLDCCKRDIYEAVYGAAR